MTAHKADRDAVGDFAFQSAMLQKVSRTFALTIPQLPDPLRKVVGNAYLLCRIADTIEDEQSLSVPQKQALLGQFGRVISGDGAPDRFASELRASLSSGTPAAEQALAAAAARVVRITHGFNLRQQRALDSCISIMARGMVEFQQKANPGGLKDLLQLDRYCYYVAGVVGEMLVELFCDYSSELDLIREELLHRSVSLGKGLQMTNILKDLWIDLDHGVCWLPSSVFAAAGFDLRTLGPGESDPRFVTGLRRLIAITRAHLEEGLQFVLLIPSHEAGIRRYLLWTLGLSVLALRRLYLAPSFHRGEDVKLSPALVGTTIFLTRTLARSDAAIRGLFRSAMRGLPRPEAAVPQQPDR